MKADPSGPADTSMMGIVHRALRRDLARARAALTADWPPADDQRVAIAAHLDWLMQFLHRHHEAEDEGLYPLVRRRSPAAAAMLDVMDADHHAIGPAMAGLEEAAAEYGRSASGRAAVLTALDRLDEVLLPHLRREEDEMMPLVSAAITEAEWQEIEQAYNIKPLGPLELADTGHEGRAARRLQRVALRSRAGPRRRHRDPPVLPDPGRPGLGGPADLAAGARPSRPAGRPPRRPGKAGHPRRRGGEIAGHHGLARARTGVSYHARDSPPV
jgi:hemerythrin-like domain-containing protein